jgi:hypothetical protein
VLSATGARTVLLDIAMTSPDRSPSAVFDLTERLYLTRITGSDPSLAPTGENLIQASARLRPGESIEQATRRIESVMDAGLPGGRERETWRRRSLADLADTLGLPRSTAHRYLASLVALGQLEQTNSRLYGRADAAVQ